MQKTSFVIQLIPRQKAKKTLIYLLNATSVAALTADFDHLHVNLGLGESKNTNNSVRSRLSKPENSQQLLVFDNSDEFTGIYLL